MPLAGDGSAGQRQAEAVDVQFDAVIDKTDKGFGIYFARVAATDRDFLAVDGFVEMPKRNDSALEILQLGDVLVGVNGNDCRGRAVDYTLSLLRSAESGGNTLSFVRSRPQADPGTVPDPLSSSAGGIMGALLNVKSKIQAEINGGEEELLLEQLEDERFERQWLAEFEMLKKQYESKWETCSYTADEFCGLLYRSSDVQQRARLLQEYPTLMGAWENHRAAASSSRVIPEWPASKVAYKSVMAYQYSAVSNTSPRSIHCSQSLHRAIGCLQKNFMWRSNAVDSFSRRLEESGISSCTELVEAIDARSGYFERNFQSKHYPRLSKTILRTLRANAWKEDTTGSHGSRS
ncbi:X-ray repair cross-complementing protein 6 [Phytophthora boehmeriae]|uniref:X-ray repair cross-complementing protein 6 n=1 Tax=Phytophthora boehmeriae TaxID=109152 RepID=A0A8T1WV99_9STRA|nr:X-ray repair cross-complementing protein 6 [Phytophthora boehmeriae]